MKTLFMICRRAAAFLYDALLMLAAFFVVTGAAVYLNDMERVGGAWFALLLWLVSGAFLVLFWRNGRTLGMQAWGLRIVRADAAPDARASRDGAELDAAPGLGALAARYALGTLLFGLTWVWMPFDRERLALHDRLSGTRIVRGRG